MFADISTSSAERITEIRDHLSFIAPLIPPPPTATPRYLNTSKGLIFVELYGVIEFTILATVSRAIDSINADRVKLQELHPVIWGMALNPHFEALQMANRKKWDKRQDLLQAYMANGEAVISNALMPTNGDNFTHKQLQSIWNAFGMSEPLFHDPNFQWRLQDIVVNRINIAHGNNSAADIGARVTPTDLGDRISEVSSYCSYLISVFEDYIKDKKYHI